jgi:lipoprotein-releasing system permease protein
MFRPVALYVGLRYTRAKRRNHYISFISLASMLGIGLGVMVLITVLSVMNGFDHEIRERIFGMASQVSISSFEPTGISDWQQVSKKVQGFKDVQGVAPYVQGQAMLSNLGTVQPVLVSGILPAEEAHVSDLYKKVVAGSFKALQPGANGVVLGRTLANNLGLEIGDKVSMIIPEASVTPLGIIPRYKRYTLVGVFEAGGGFKFDTAVAYIYLNDAQKLYKMGENVTGLRLRVSELYAAPRVTDELIDNLDSGKYNISNWTDEYGSFFQAIRMEKTMMFVILVLIIAVAAFNLVSSLVMVVTDKRAEIAILRTLGASPGTIMATFMVQGCVVGVVGTLMGVLGGVALALNVTFLVEKLQNLLQTKFINSNIYFINYLPSKLDWSDVAQITLIALAMALVATIYPAWTAARTQPAEALRYE